MRVRDTRSVSIAGGGMSGALLAILLAQRGFEIDLYERRPDPRAEAPAGAGSFNLSLGERGRHALRQAGLEQVVAPLVTRMEGRMIHDRAGRTTLQPYGVHAYEALYAISRDRLVRCLLDRAQASGRVRFHFGRGIEAVDWENRKLDLGGGETRGFDVLFGADGPGSRVRQAIREATGMTVTQALLDAGWKKLLIPPKLDGSAPLDPSALHVWPRGGYMMVAMPDCDRSFSALLFLPNRGDHRMPWGFEELDSWTRQQAFMEFNFPDAAPLIPHLREELGEQATGLMGTIRCSQWHLGGKALLVGDAAHTIVPFHGQGVNAAFEDCTALMEILDGGATEWSGAFEALQAARMADADAIAEMALDAYRVVRDSVRHRDFMLRKALERELERRHPGLFVPRYSLVMFHRVPYAEALRRGQRQGRILDELLAGKHDLAEVDLPRADHLVTERLQPL